MFRDYTNGIYFALYHWYKEVPGGPYEVYSSCRVLPSMLFTVGQVILHMFPYPKFRSEGLYKDGHAALSFFCD